MYYLKSLPLLFIILLSSCSPGLNYTNIQSEEKCNCKKDSYWYNSTCWKNYEDERIPKNEIDSIVESELIVLKNSTILLNNHHHPLTSFFPYEEGKEVILITNYTKEDQEFTMLTPFARKKMRSKRIEAPSIVYKGNVLQETMDTVLYGSGSAQLHLNKKNEDRIKVNGHFIEAITQDSISFDYIGDMTLSGMGASKIQIKGDEAFLSGDLGTITYHQIKEMIVMHPEVKTLVLTQISGSVNDAVNMHTGRLVHEAGLNTKVLKNSEIASGGVDLFCAGNKRIVEQGAKVGIHSWCCLNDLTAAEIPENHPAHEGQIEFFTMALGPDIGPKFYFHTLTAAPFDGIHWMSDDDIIKWQVATEFIPTKK